MRGRHFRPKSLMAIQPSALDVLFMLPMVKENEELDGATVVHVCGPLEHKSGGFFDSYEDILARFGEALEGEADTVILRIDSPGGDADGLVESVREMARIKDESGKTVLAYADEIAASAAYAIATIADEIGLPETGGVGSIGVISCLYERTRRDDKEGLTFEIIASGARKSDGNPHVEIAEKARERARSRVDSLAGIFFDMVADSRPVSAAKVEALQADVFHGDEAITAGLADTVSSWREFVAKALDNQDFDASEHGRGTAAERVDSMKIADLRKAKARAQANLKNAKTAKASKRAAEELVKAASALASFEAITQYEAAARVKAAKADEEEESTEAADDEDDADDDEDEDMEDEEDESDEEDDSEDEDAKHAGEEAPVVRKKAKSVSGHKAAYLALKAIEQLRKDTLRAEVTHKVDLAVLEAKVTPSQRDFLIASGMRDKPGLDKYLASATPAVSIKAHLPREYRDAVDSGLTSEQASIAHNLGLPPDVAKKAASELSKLNGSTPRR